jgi:hypothetical protein
MLIKLFRDFKTHRCGKSNEECCYQERCLYPMLLVLVMVSLYTLMKISITRITGTNAVGKTNIHYTRVYVY